MNSFRVISRNGGFWLEKDGWTFNLEPPEVVKLSLPPYVEGIDWFILNSSRLKNIASEFMKVTFSEEMFLGCDARLEYTDSAFGGWIYSISKEFLDFSIDRKIWICSQMNLYFDKPPTKLYTCIERH
jgi:hypothetical protein